MKNIAVSTKVFGQFKYNEHLDILSKSKISQIELSTDCFSIFEEDKDFSNLKDALSIRNIKTCSIHVPFCIEKSKHFLTENHIVGSYPLLFLFLFGVAGR